MVIFHTDHWGALSFFIALSVERHKDDFKVLCFSETEEDKKQILLKLCDIKIFDKIILLNDQFPGAKSEDVKEITESVLNAFDSGLKNNGVSIAINDTVYSSTDFQGIFRLYLIKKKIKYIHVMLTNWDIYDKYHDTALLKLGIVTKTYMDLLNKEHVYDNINSDLADTILTCFIERQDLDILRESELILLSQSNGYIQAMLVNNGFSGNDYYEQVLMYQEIIDFYAGKSDKHIVIKPHPNNFIRWKEHLQNAVVINKNVPIEIVRLCKGIKIKNALSIQTTSIDKMKGVIENNIITTADIAIHHNNLYSLYVCCALCAAIDPNTVIEGIGFRRNFFEKFTESAVADLNIKGVNKTKDYYNFDTSFFRIFYMQSMDIRRIFAMVNIMDNKSVLMLIDTGDQLPLQMLDESVFKYMAVIQITKECTQEKTLVSSSPEYVWLFAKSKEIRDKIRETTTKKICKNVGVEVHSKALTDFEKQMYFENYKSKNELCALKTKVSFSNVINDPVKHLDKVTAFEEYIYRLSRAHDLIVFISVKDNAGKVFTYTQLSLTADLNLKTKWNQIGWNSYIAVIDNNHPQVELLSKGGQPLIYDGSIDALRVHIESHSYDKGNFASITLNDAEYAVNERGFNFVIYDKAQKKVIDRVCFDMFKEKPVCIRKDERA